MRAELFAGRYELVDPVGDGGMGSVWRAWDHRRGAYVAAKVLRHTDAEALLRFVREQALRVAHPHVVAPSGWAAEDDRVLLTMDLVRGGSVRDLLADYGPLPLPHVVVLLGQLLDGLGAVHAHGVVHRDVKPANLLLEPTGRGRPFLRLADFGIAVVRGEPRLTSRSSFLGTPGYIAPEVIGGSSPDARQDLYPVGVVAAEMINGRLPAGWPSATPGPRPAHVPQALWGLIHDLLAAEPADRPATAADAAERLRTAGVDTGRVDPDHPDAIEVFEHVGPLPTGYGPNGPRPRTAPHTPPDPGTAPTPRPAARTPPEPGAGPGSQAVPPAAAEAPERRGRRVGIVAGAVAALAGIGLVVAALNGVFDAGPGAGRAPSPASSTGTSTGPGTASSTVRIGTACGAVEGVTARATDGSLAVCRRGADGHLRWARS